MPVQPLIFSHLDDRVGLLSTLFPSISTCIALLESLLEKDPSEAFHDHMTSMLLRMTYENFPQWTLCLSLNVSNENDFCFQTWALLYPISVLAVFSPNCLTLHVLICLSALPLSSPIISLGLLSLSQTPGMIVLMNCPNLIKSTVIDTTTFLKHTYYSNQLLSGLCRNISLPERTS